MAGNILAVKYTVEISMQSITYNIHKMFENNTYSIMEMNETSCRSYHTYNGYAWHLPNGGVVI